MLKNNKTLIIGIIAFLAALCYGASSTPFNGEGWDTAAPDIDQPIGNHYQEIFDLRKGVAIRINKEHETLATSSAGGVHKQGSARAFFQDAAPTTQINGDAWDSGDTGSLWFDTNSTPDNLVYVLTSSASTGTWTLLSVSMTAEIVAATHTWALDQTFTENILIQSTKGIFADTSDASDTASISFAGGGAAASTRGGYSVFYGEDHGATPGRILLVPGDSGEIILSGATESTGTIDPTAYATARGGFKDEPTLSSDSATAVASQQSIKAYVDAGANKVTDGSVVTGYRYCSVNDGAVQQVFTKYFTGTLVADSSTSVAHGVTLANILHVSAFVEQQGSGTYRASGYGEGTQAILRFDMQVDATNVTLANVGSSMQSGDYRIKVEYTI